MTTALRRIQYTMEATRGTQLAATQVLYGALQYTDTRSWISPEDEERNSLALLHRQVEISKQTDLQFTASLTYQQIIPFLSIAVKGAITPTIPTNGIITRLWTYLPSLTASNAQDSLSIEYGDDQQEYECPHVMCSQLELAFAMGEAGSLTATMFGQGTSKSTFTGSVTQPYYLAPSGAGVTVEDVASQDISLYVDTSWAGLGGTVQAATLAGATIRLPTGLSPQKYADGSTNFSTFSESKRAAEIELTLRHNTLGEAQYDAYVASTLQFIRLQAIGSVIEAVTPTYNHTLTMDFAMRYTEPPQFFEDYNGHNTVVLRGRTFQDPTSGNDFGFTVQTNVLKISAATP